MRVVRVEIGEIVLRGFERVDGARVRAAAARELERLVAGDRAWPAARPSIPRLDARATAMPPSSAPEALGREVAQVVHRELAP
jgi:hypothetical protein